MQFEIFKQFINFGVVGIISFIFIKFATKLIEQTNDNFQKLFNNSLNNNKLNIESMGENINKLAIIIDKNIKIQEDYINKISIEVSKLKQEIFETDSKIIQMILDDKKINSATFLKISYFIIKATTYITILDILNYIDSNVFMNEYQINNFKDFCENTFESKKQKIQQELLALKYNTEIIKKIDNKINSLYATSWSLFQSKVIIQMSDTEYRDSANKNLKTKVINNFICLSDELIECINTLNGGA